MDFQELVQKRQSTRKYSDKEVDRELVTRCLEAARLAPSACNSQPWHFIIVDDPGIIKEIGEAAASLGMNKFAAEKDEFHRQDRQHAEKQGLLHARPRHRSRTFLPAGC